MTNLTEKWKAGELEEGYYYIKVNKTLSYVEIDYYHILGETKYWSGNDEEDICEIIDKVPSYKELQKLKSDNLAKNEGQEIVAELEYKYKKTLKENRELRQKVHILNESAMKMENIIGELGSGKK